MRTKIDFGIDLGTTNSAIARIENGKPVIKKSDTLKDTIPSCVSINKKKDILVGDPANNVLKNDTAHKNRAPLHDKLDALMKCVGSVEYTIPVEKNNQGGEPNHRSSSSCQ